MSEQNEKPKTLVFLCAENSARSQMAEELARASAPAGWKIFSAGSRPTLPHPFAIEVMREIGLDISDSKAKGLDAVPVNDADYVVCLCEEELATKIETSAETLNWALPDPVGLGDQIRFQLDSFRSARDEIKRKIDSFWSDQGR